MDSRIENITKLLQDQRTLATKLVEVLSPEIMSYDMISADNERKRRENKLLDDEKLLARMEIEKAKETAGKFILEGKDEAAKLVSISKDNIMVKMIEANKLLDQVKEFVSETDKKRYMKLRDSVEKVA